MGIDPLARAAEGPAANTLITAVEAANRSELFGEDRELSFSRDEQSRRVLIQIKDRKTGEVVQQIPPKELLEMVRNLQIRERSRQNR
jgi:uncharacterized FlaG/YvyC family protein